MGDDASDLSRRIRGLEDWRIEMSIEHRQVREDIAEINQALKQQRDLVERDRASRRISYLNTALQFIVSLFLLYAATVLART